MGIIKQGILGGFSGKVANVVGSSWKGIAVIKSQPLSVSNPRTAAQVGQRTKMSACVAILKQITSQVLKPLNDRFAGQMSGYNYSLQESIKAFDANGNLVAPASLKISRSGNKGTLIDAVADDKIVKAIDVEFQDESGSGYALATDKCYLVGYNENTGEIAVSTESAREDARAVLSFPNEGLTTGNKVHLWMAFLRADGTVGFAQDYKLHTIS